VRRTLISATQFEMLESVGLREADAPTPVAIDATFPRWAFDVIYLEHCSVNWPRLIVIDVQPDLFGYLITQRASRGRPTGAPSVRQWYTPTLGEAIALAGQLGHQWLSKHYHWRRKV
jgi:hypothetical protein